MQRMKISSPEKMKQLGETLAKTEKILLLKGDLGAGKTVLAKGFAKGIGIDEDTVQSPTYAYVNVYEDKMIHLDMYRIEKYEDVIDKGLLDQISQFDYVVIEWPKFIDKLGLNEYVIVDIKKLSGTQRQISVKKD